MQSGRSAPIDHALCILTSHFHTCLQHVSPPYSEQHGRDDMEGNRQVTIFGFALLVLVWAGCVFASAAVSPEHPVQAALVALVVFPALLAAVLATIAGLNVLIFAPLLNLLARWSARR